jgi:peptidoglycan/xylan/chitin deacetylase (PgdA/CDA1 family)
MPIALLYHDITAPGHDDASGFAGPGAARYKLTPAQFAAHLDRLAESTRQRPTTLTQRAALPTDDWLLTFDDGGVSSLDIADALEARGWRGWFFMTTDRIGTPGFLTKSQLQDLHRRGHTVGTHSCSHPARMSYCSPTQLLDEWRRSRFVLEDVLAAPVRCGSVPGGFYSPAVATAAAEAELMLLFTSEPVSRMNEVAGCTVCGRYAIYRGTSAASAARLLSSPWPRWRQSALWTAKKLAKSLGGEWYLRLREQFWRRAYAPS